MTINRKTLMVTSAWLIFFLASLACRLPGAKPAITVMPTHTPIPVSSQAVSELEEQVQSAEATAQTGGSLRLEITETQLTSLIAIQLQAMQEPQVEDVQVHLQNGQIQLTGAVKQDKLSLPFSVTLEITIVKGQPYSRVVEAKVGPLPLPESMLEQITSQVDQLIQLQILTSYTNVVIDEITIANGLMTMTGHMR